MGKSRCGNARQCDNAKKLDELNSARMTNATTAVEHINSYGVSAYAHADGIKRFASSF
jgi:hypothetical protein